LVFRSGFSIEGEELRDKELSLVMVEGDISKVETKIRLDRLLVVCVE
ncbi:12127_t:CDS:1, partial [Dentiscutata heterogama]